MERFVWADHLKNLKVTLRAESLAVLDESPVELPHFRGFRLPSSTDSRKQTRTIQAQRVAPQAHWSHCPRHPRRFQFRNRYMLQQVGSFS